MKERILQKSKKCKGHFSKDLYTISEASGSVQVVEMSFVLPVVMAVTMGLVYLTFALFAYSYALSSAENTTVKLANSVGKDNMYWVIFDDRISKGTAKSIMDELKSGLDACCVLPGMKAECAYQVESLLMETKVEVSVKMKYFGKTIFNLKSEEDVYKPAEFALNADFFQYGVSEDPLSVDEMRELYEIFKNFGEIYEKFF